MSIQSLLLPLIIVLFAVPLFLGTRKQKRAAQAQQNLQSSLAPGDRVMTTSGLYATVVSSNDDTIDLEIAEGYVTTWLRAAVREKVADTGPDFVDVDADADETYDASEHEEIVEDTPGEPVSTAELAPPLEQSSKKSS
ncbi:MAG TPA: preprotein translocase subunit YajC [Pseudonocardiaceae bacterium]|jgi:preprotein translocase subunit YajC|nr:preprotein translocase subunit YajC [Pseudonocardiaceae bacterium]